MMKKLLFLVLTVLSTSAIAQTFTSGGINYTITDPILFKVEVGNNIGFSGIANIPETVIYSSQSYTVTSIGDYAFSSGLTSITLGNGVKSIGEGAFFQCYGLKSVIIPDGVTSIGNEAFFNCAALTSVTIGNGVTNIGESAFYFCPALTSVTIGNGVTSIGARAFYDCIGLTTLNSYAQTPPTLDATVFFGVNQASCTLNVNNAAAVAAYEAALYWTNFNPINGTLLSKGSFVKNLFSLYPNPSKGIVNLYLENNIPLEKVTFYNQLGQVVKKATSNTITTSELAKGSYFVEVITNEGKAAKQLIVQ